MSRLIEADALLINLDGMMAISPTGYIHGETVADMINDAPTVDAVPVVRCEHCAHKKNCQWYYYSGDDYGFCNWAVREEHEIES